MNRGWLWVMCLFVGATTCTVAPGPRAPAGDPIDRGLDFLAPEVRSWRGAKGCYSCHNNGDAARAVYLRVRLRAQQRAQRARQRQHITDPIPDTSNWLAHPERWQGNGAQGPFNDKALARLQFAVALVALDDAGLLNRAAALQAAADLLARDQAPDGAWQQTHTGNIGSPITYGPVLATALARRVLAHVSTVRYRTQIAAADRWLRNAPARNVVEASGVLIGLARATDPLATRRRKECLQLLARAQGRDGGFGPYVNAAPEAFDTALAILALLQARADGPASIPRAVAYLLSIQEPDGSWPETTRPADQNSYAHRISTTGWALQALLSAGDRGV